MDAHIDKIGYIDDPNQVNEHKLAPRAYHIPSHALNLNGTWKFRLHDTVAQAFFQGLAGADQPITVPGHWQLQGHGSPIYTNIKYPFPVNPPFAPLQNPTGVYTRQFKVKSTENLVHRLRFDGVDSAYWVFVNQKYVGFAKGSRNPAEFDVSKVLSSGSNSITVIVSQWSDGSYIEDQDQWWLSGIFRDVHLIGYPVDGHIDDFALVTSAIDFDTNSAHVEVEVRIQAQVDTDLSVKVSDPTAGASVSGVEISPWSTRLGQAESVWVSRLTLSDATLWSAERPFLYEVEIVLKRAGTDEVIDTVHTHLGVRTSQIVDGLLLINNKPVLLLGVNRHDNNAHKGRAISEKDVEHDLLLMKRHNVNTIRCSHYPSHPSLVFLADKLGFYVIDETDLECHGFGEARAGGNADYDINDPPQAHRTDPRFFNWPQEFASDNALWANAYLDRVKNLVYRDRTHPSVIMWSLGNESFFGNNHRLMYNYLKAEFPHWPVHYEGDNNAWSSTVDVDSCMYPNHAWLEDLGKRSDRKKPLILCEYGHAMGNGPGAFDEYLELFRKYPRLQGGCVWEWANHGLVKPVPGSKDKTFYAYGGDFGESEHDGTFVMDGLNNSEHKPTPAMVQLKHIYRPVDFVFSESETHLKVRALSNLLFADLSDYHVQVVVTALPMYPTGTVHELANENFTELKGDLEVDLSQAEYYTPSHSVVATARLKLAHAKPWADKGFELCFGQHVFKPKPAFVFKDNSLAAGLEQLTTNSFEVSEVGPLYHIKYGSSTISVSKITGQIDLGANIKGPKLGVWRAPTDNDIRGDMGTWKWYKVHLLQNNIDTVTVKTIKDTVEGRQGQACKIVVTSWLAPPVLQWGIAVSQTIVVGVRDQALELDVKIDIEPKGHHPESLPRLGLDFELPDSFQSVKWVGRGPGESYPDSKTGCPIGYYEAEKADLFTSYDVPQDNGNRSDCKWVSLEQAWSVLSFRAKSSVSAVSLGQPLSFQVQPYDPFELEAAAHPYDLDALKAKTHFSVNLGVHGLGSASCGPGVLDRYKFYLEKKSFEVRLAL